MAKRSLQASPPGIQQAKRAFSLIGWTQDQLATEVNLKTRQPIWRFFTGKPVDRQVFMEICHILDLDWREIALDPPESPEVANTPHFLGIEQLVKQTRSQHRDAIQHCCGVLQLLDINHPVEIDDIYVDLNILEAVQNQQWFELAELNNLEPTEFDRIGLGLIEQPQVSGMQAVETYSKLRVLGRPGVGKTTFLKHLAVRCNKGEFATEQVPVYITLRQFAEFAKRAEDFNLFNYIQKILANSSGITDPSTLERLLNQGRVLILMDGMDEVKSQDITTVTQEIRNFSDQYHHNRFVASCRTAAQKFCIHGFTDVEIAPFTEEQITTFAHKWFTALSKTATSSRKTQAAQFVQKLGLPENWKFRQLVETPLFLHLACWVFEGEGQLPSKQTTFYKQGLDLLLGKWDETKGVERDNAYREFRLSQKMKLLSQLAAITFEKGQYFFDQRTIEQYIEDYLQNPSDTNPDSEELQLESEAILKSIEAQHGLLIERARGIYSFSYLVFQEYLTARKIVATHNLRSLENALGGLVKHITDPHWHEVFLLTASMLRSADSLVQLMKQEIDALVAEDPYLQKFLDWASQKSQTISTEPKIATNRAFYLSLAKNSQTDYFALTSTLDQGTFLDAALENFLSEFDLDQGQISAQIQASREALSHIIAMVQDNSFYKALQQLKNELPTPHYSQTAMQTWWQRNYNNWIEQLKVTISHYRNIYHPWEFSEKQQKILKRYYDANQLLVDCLNSNSEITSTVRQEIEATLLMPQEELEDREWQGNNNNN